ncbi:MAG: ATP-binding cassette domain-containing protein [Candidatus Bathyarchaeota archaeon]|uniref:ECF transporter S component n=1 Tax=Candidatus Bathycorpusculum sp. TaxID=2994959 RepID=UPI0028318F4C|nr:ATP-binding cassette domain-containing protein [Candidatus Termiticorpusculum sp.]MCL2292481.1 ATP-binding cassette domain-containing protein [Candidatus Termiticorpusculum sp.]
MESNKQNANTCVVIKNLTFTYPERDNPALSEINLFVRAGEFVVLCGPSGCGKTTLLRQLKPVLVPHGAKSGEVLFEDTLLSDLSERDAAAKIGFVMQSPDNQVVTDKVWHELAFGLESLGFDTPTIRLRVAEMASFFGIQTWFYKNVTELSGGQKQLLALASVMALQPSLLILDEPTSQLDPIAAADFLATVGKINRELGVTVILTEHRLEEAFPLASHVVVLDKGKIVSKGNPAVVGEALRSWGHGMFHAMPVPMRVWAGVENVLPCPITVRDGREWLSQMEIKQPLPAVPPLPPRERPVIELDEVWFKYDKDAPDVIKGLSFKAYSGVLTAVLGGNGTGKTTTLSLIAGLNKPYRGKVRIQGVELDKFPAGKLFDKLLGALPQNPQSLFVAKTVREDLLEILSESKLSKAEKQEKMRNMVLLCRLEGLLDFHPYDLSGGEQQRVALAKVLLLEPRILLLDEPTKGLDAEFKTVFASILRKLTIAGVAVVMVSHDVEFCAEHADRCALFFDGNIVTENSPRAFFSGNSFYTSAANRMARHVLPEAVTANDVISTLGGTPPLPPELPDNGGYYNIDYNKEDEKPDITKSKPAAKKLTLPRIGAICTAGVAFILTVLFAALHWDGFTAFISGGNEAVVVASDPAAAWLYVGLMLAFGFEVLVIVTALSWRRGQKEWTVQVEPSSRKLSRRTIAAAVMILLAIPLTLYVGIFYLGDRNYYFISMLIILETMLPFMLVFERRKPQARELAVIAVLCAIGVAGRTAFFMLPQFKPVVAIVIIAGVAFGGEAGFLVGAMTGFVSNMFFGQGPWTPWQMFAFGIIGFLAGVLFKKGLLLRSKLSLCVFGGLTTFLIYGGLMNPAMVLMLQSDPTRAMFLAAYLQGIPFDLVHAFATVVFLYVAARPMLEKLDRIKVKYGLIS